MNLITDAWIPVRIGQDVRRISPLDLPRSGAAAPASPRADFDAAIHEFLVALFQTCAPPADDHEWSEVIDAAPSADELRRHFAPFLPAFDLEHPEHPFLQERGLDEGERSTVTDLLIDTPGGATVEDNKDLFVKRRPGGDCCVTCATLALLTLQAFSPAGGRGNMTSIRGGGPISSLVHTQDLWTTTWANTLPLAALGVQGPPHASSDVFPWLRGADPPKNKRPKLHLADVHPLHVFWGMPRRVLLAPTGTATSCVLCGDAKAKGVAGYWSRPYGLDYQGSWAHPLSPTQENKGEVSARKGRADLGGYRNWVGLVAASADGSRRPALVVHESRASPERRRRLGRSRIRAAAYAMDNAKVEGWYEGTMPLFPADESLRGVVDAHARALVSATEEAAGLLRSTYKEASYDRPKDVRGDFGHLTNPLWSRTEATFYESLSAVSMDPTAQKRERVAWMRLLIRETRGLFALHVQYDRIGDADPQRIVRAEAKLNGLLRRTLTKILDITPVEATPEMAA